MRKVLRNNEEVAHYWANKVQSEGSAYSMFFEDDTIYSYGNHFAIAKHYDNLILFTTRSYSVSTSKHISYTRHAIPHTNIIHCYNPAWPADPENLSDAINTIEFNLKKAIKARQRKQEYLNTAESTYNQLLLLIKTFKIKGWKVPKYDFSIPEDIMVKIKEREAKADRKRKAAKQAKQAKQDKIDMVEFLEDVEKWKKSGLRTDCNIRHRRFIHQISDVCRVNGDIVESMRSCSVPLKEAKVLLKAIKAGKFVAGAKVGHYTVTSCTTDKLIIGCHEFLRSEIDSLMKTLDI